MPFVLTYGPSHLPLARADRPGRSRLQETEKFWNEWCSRCTHDGEYRDLVMRSLITLKALTFAPTGGIVAAPTTSLPEKLGGARNWDYRFCWLRDATFTLLALMNSRLYRGSLGLAQLAAARGGGLAGQHADHVRHLGPAAAAGMGGGLASTAMRAPSRCGSAMPRMRSCSSTSTAN